MWIASRIRTARAAKGLDGGGKLQRLSNDKVMPFENAVFHVFEH